MLTAQSSKPSITSLVAVPTLLQAVQGQMGATPTLGLGSDVSGENRVDAYTRKRIAVAVAAVNAYTHGQGACLDFGVAAAQRMVGSENSAVAAAVGFAVRVARAGGYASEADMQLVRAAGYDELQVLEIVTHVAACTIDDRFDSHGGDAWG